MALIPQALTQVATLRQWLTQNRTDETGGRLSDGHLEALITRATAAIETYCDRRLVARATAETWLLDGPGGSRLVLPEWPVAELTSLAIDGEAIPPRAALGDIGYLAREAEAWLDLVGYRFTRGQQNVAVVARLGYDPAMVDSDRRHRRALADLEQACLQLCGYWFEKPAAARLTVGGEAAERYLVEPWPAEVRGLLGGYRRLGG